MMKSLTVFFSRPDVVCFVSWVRDTLALTGWLALALVVRDCQSGPPDYSDCTCGKDTDTLSVPADDTN